MANLLEVSELAWRQLFPNPNNQPTIQKEEFIASARHLYAEEVLLKYFNERRSEGYSEIPSLLLHEDDFEVLDNQVDLSKVSAMTGMPDDMWLGGVSGLSNCRYIKSSYNLYRSLYDDDAIGSLKPYYPVGRKIKFPMGTGDDVKLTVTYAALGKRVDDRVEVDSHIAGRLRKALVELYGGKIGKEDVTNDGNSTE